MKRMIWVVLAVCGVALLMGGLVMAQRNNPATFAGTKMTPREIADAWENTSVLEAEKFRDAINDAVRSGGSEAQIGKEIETKTQPVHSLSVSLYGMVANRPEVCDELAAIELKYALYRSKKAKTAMDGIQSNEEVIVRMQAIQIAQNARIIQLLQKIAEKHK